MKFKQIKVLWVFPQCSPEQTRNGKGTAFVRGRRAMSTARAAAEAAQQASQAAAQAREVAQLEAHLELTQKAAAPAEAVKRLAKYMAENSQRDFLAGDASESNPWLKKNKGKTAFECCGVRQAQQR